MKKKEEKNIAFQVEVQKLENDLGISVALLTKKFVNMDVEKIKTTNEKKSLSKSQLTPKSKLSPNFNLFETNKDWGIQ